MHAYHKGCWSLSGGGIRPNPDLDFPVGGLRARIIFARHYAHVLSFTPSYFLACSKGAKVINEGETRPFLALFHPVTAGISAPRATMGTVWPARPSLRIVLGWHFHFTWRYFLLELDLTKRKNAIMKIRAIP